MKNVHYHRILLFLFCIITIQPAKSQQQISENLPWQYTPPAYTDTSGFFEIQTTVSRNNVQLPAVLSIPQGKGPFPVIILVHDLGPNDKDATTGKNKPFKDLAFGLASQGIAVLRYDKRSQNGKQVSINEEVIDDAIVAYNLVKDYRENNIKFSDIYILGHSLGASLSPKIMNSIDNKASGLIMIASPYRYMDEVLFDQANLLKKQAEKDSTDTKHIDEFQEKVKNLTNLRQNKKSYSPEVLPYNLSTEYWNELNKIQPVDELKNVKKPLLIMHGGMDFQVSQKEFNFFKTYLSSRKTAQFKLYPELNHLMIKSSGIASLKEYETEGHVDAAVINDIAAWIRKK